MKNVLSVLLFLCVGSVVSGIEAPDAATVKQKLRSALKNDSEKIVRKVDRPGEKTVVWESMISTEIQTQSVDPILSDFSSYRQWVLPGLNTRHDGGGEYLVKILDVIYDPGEPRMMALKTMFDIPMMKTPIHRYFHMQRDKGKDHYQICADTMNPDGRWILSAGACLYAFSSETRPKTHSWVYIKGIVKFASTVLYAVFPEKVLLGEAGGRVETLLENFQKEEARRTSTTK